MSRISIPKTTPFPIRLTYAERAELERQSKGMALGTYIRSVMLAESTRKSARSARSPVKDHAKLAQVLACLGAGRISESMSRIAKATEAGSLYVDDRVVSDIKRSCNDIAIMRALLMKSLGFQEKTIDVKESTSQAFTRAANWGDAP